MSSVNGPGGPGFIHGVPTPEDQNLGPGGLPPKSPGFIHGVPTPEDQNLGPGGLPPIGPGTTSPLLGPGGTPPIASMHITAKNLHDQLVQSDPITGSAEHALKTSIENFIEQANKPGVTQTSLAPAYHEFINQAQQLGLIPPQEPGPVIE